MSVTQASLLGDTFGSKASGTIPVGGIIMWSGSIGTIPTGWALCNGSNGTPNLQDRFIVGAGSGYAVAGTGGSANATLVSHGHTGTTNGNNVDHYHPNTNFATTGQLGYPQAGDGNTFFVGNTVVYGYGTGNLNTGGSGTNHSHSFGTSAVGSSATNANLPPYYALAFIMRTS
jgi:hypothetical protein